jgi:surface carbohydrate biosynthesis protein
MKDSILFIVDHKHRDLPALSLIGYHLEKDYKHAIHYCASSMEDEIIAKEDPKYIVIPKLTYSIFNQLKWKLEGRKILIVETEGNPQNDEEKYRITVYPDLYIFWNDHIKNHYYKKLLNNGTKISVEGNHRTDFFCEPLKSIYVKNIIKSELGIKNESRVVTIATSTHDAHLSKKREKQKRKKQGRAYKYAPDYDMNVKSLKIQKKITEQFLLEAQKEFKEDVVFVIKPHPNETILYWTDLINTNNLSNCYLMIGKNINELLSISDFHISHGVCSTTAEAMLYDLQTLELVTYLSEKIYTKNHLNLPNFQCYSSAEMIDVIKIVLSKNKKLQENIKIKNYAAKYFKKVDGRVCYRYAKKIDEFIMDQNLVNNRVSLFHSIKYNLIFSLMNLRNKIFISQANKQKRIVEEVHRDIENISDSKSYRIVKGKSVHKEYGLYDNKINPLDYKYWYKKFDEIEV